MTLLLQAAAQLQLPGAQAIVTIAQVQVAETHCACRLAEIGNQCIRWIITVLPLFSSYDNGPRSVGLFVDGVTWFSLGPWRCKTRKANFCIYDF